MLVESGRNWANLRICAGFRLNVCVRTWVESTREWFTAGERGSQVCNFSKTGGSYQTGEDFSSIASPKLVAKLR